MRKKMKDQDEKEVIDKFHSNVQWLREHVAPDDIYEFAQQAIMASEYLIEKLHTVLDVEDEIDRDKMLYHWVNNIFSLHMLKEKGFDGIIDVSWKVDRK